MAFYTFNEYEIPDYMEHPIKMYLEHQVHPGDFLYAILCNDFVHALCHADHNNLRNIPAYAAFLFNELPITVWGSKEIVEKHLSR